MHIRDHRVGLEQEQFIKSPTRVDHGTVVARSGERIGVARCQFHKARDQGIFSNIS
jgi:hypothetical protein